MTKFTALKGSRKFVGAAVMAAGLAMLTGFAGVDAAAQGQSRTWSIVVHIEYLDGFVYEGLVASGVSNEDKVSMLRDCNSSHAHGSAVRFHCFSIPE